MPSASATTARRRSPAGGLDTVRCNGCLSSLEAIDFLARAITPPGRTRRFDARFLVVEARFIAGRIDGVVHPQAELVELVWTPLDKARGLDLPEITHTADDLAQALEGGLDKRRRRPFYREERGRRLREELQRPPRFAPDRAGATPDRRVASRRMRGLNRFCFPERRGA